MRSVKAKIERAKSRFSEIKQLSDIFLSEENQPFSIYHETLLDNCQEAIMVRLVKPIPEEISAAIGDAITNLRSALDHLVCRLAERNGATNVRDVYFPFTNSKTDFEKSPNIDRKIRKLCSEAQIEIRSLKPYLGGDDLLYALNQLSAVDKHRDLIGVIASLPDWRAALEMKSLGKHEHKFAAAKRLQLGYVGKPIFLYPLGGELNGNLEVTHNIAFREPPCIKHLEILSGLNSLIQKIESIVGHFEAKFFV